MFSIKASGGVTRVSVGEVNATGRVTMGVRFISLTDDDTVVAIARNAERAVVADEEELDEVVDVAQAEDHRRSRAGRRRGDRPVSTPNAPGARQEQWGSAQPTATMPPVRDQGSSAADDPAGGPAGEARRARLVLAGSTRGR